jgi:hypothetical protein
LVAVLVPAAVVTLMATVAAGSAAPPSIVIEPLGAAVSRYRL